MQAELSANESEATACDRLMRMPRIIHRGAEMHALVEEARRSGKRVGLVPTMGALHEGHLSLVGVSCRECDLTVVTIFVNPTQFGPNEDFERYPRNLEGDVALVGRRGCDIVFAPSVEEMYPPGSSTFVDVGPLGQVFEGAIRPTHFRGVATIVLKLFQLVRADRAYFGRKDYQQTLVIRRMVEDLNVPIEVRVCPIVREADGLAMSSRNAYLSPPDRKRATVLWQALELAKGAVERGEREVAPLRAEMVHILAEQGIEPDYIAFVKEGTLEAVERVEGPTTVAIAAHVGVTRLIDNLVIG